LHAATNSLLLPLLLPQMHALLQLLLQLELKLITEQFTCLLFLQEMLPLHTREQQYLTYGHSILTLYWLQHGKMEKQPTLEFQQLEEPSFAK
jgi:hypothetical protein